MPDPTHVDFNLKRKIHVPPPPPPTSFTEANAPEEVSQPRMFLWGILAGFVFAAIVWAAWRAGLNTFFYQYVLPEFNEHSASTMVIIVLLAIIFFRRRRFFRPHVPPKNVVPPLRLVDVVKLHPRGDDKPPAA